MDQEFNPWEEVKLQLLDKRLIPDRILPNRAQQSSKRGKFPSKAYAQFLQSSRKKKSKGNRRHHAQQQTEHAEQTEFSGFSQADLGTDTKQSLGSSSVQSAGAVLFDLSCLIALEVQVTEEIESRLAQYLEGIMLKLYREHRRFWQGETDELGSVYAFWMSARKLVICIHELALSSVPSWIDEISRYTNLTALDLVGVKALTLLSYISPSDIALQKEWLQLCSVPAPLIFTGGIAEFTTAFQRSKSTKRARPPKNLARCFNKLKPTESNQTNVVRIVFLGPRHIRIFIDSTARDSLWQSLARSSQVRSGDENEWKRVMARS